MHGGGHCSWSGGGGQLCLAVRDGHCRMRLLFFIFAFQLAHNITTEKWIHRRMNLSQAEAMTRLTLAPESESEHRFQMAPLYQSKCESYNVHTDLRQRNEIACK